MEGKKGFSGYGKVHLGWQVLKEASDEDCNRAGEEPMQLVEERVLGPDIGGKLCELTDQRHCQHPLAGDDSEAQ